MRNKFWLLSFLTSAGIFSLLPHVALAQAPIITGVSASANAIEQFEKLELTVQFTGAYTNAYDYDDILITGIFTAPSGKKDTVEGFYFENFILNTGTGNITPTGNNSFRIRYAPSELGNYSYKVTCKNLIGNTESVSYNFQSGPSEKKGFIKKNASNYLNFDNGEQYIPIGQNLAWQQNNKYLNFKTWTDKLADNKANFIRLWQCHWGLGIEWTGTPYNGLKRYSAVNSFYTDQLLEECRTKDIFMMLCINHHGMVSTSVNPEWSTSPYNAANGGPCANTWDYFTNTTAKNLHKNRLRYILARWGYSRNIMSWELFNEVEWTDNFNTYKTQIKDWHKEMAQYIKSKDPFRHLVTTSYAYDNQDAATWNLPEMDFTQTHYYNGSANVETILVDGLRSYLAQFSKPTFTGEFGVNTSQSNLSSADPNGIHIHNSLWATLFGGGIGAGASWWWDSYIDPRNLYTQYKGPATIAGKIDLYAENYKPTIGTVSGGGNADAIVSPGAGWGRSPSAAFTVDATGVITPSASNLGQYIYGQQCKPAEKNSPTFTVTFPSTAQFVVTTSDVSGFCNAQRIQILVDGIEVLNTPANANTAYAINVSAGLHTIKVDNAGGDWYRVGSYKFSNLGTALNTYLLKSNNSKRLAGWVHNKKYNWIDVPAGNIPAAVTGATLSIPGVSNGTYQVKWFECMNGTETSSALIGVNNNTLVLPCPIMPWDAAFTANELTTLPVKLLSFTGVTKGKANLLFVNIAEAKNVKDIWIERSKDGIVFSPLGKINATNDNYAGSHQFEDGIPFQLQNYYRLKMTDKDGRVEFSNIVLLQQQTEIGISIYPNPANKSIVVRGEKISNQPLMATILNASGIVLQQQSIANINTGATIEVSKFPAGQYYCILKDANGKIIANKSFVKR